MVAFNTYQGPKVKKRVGVYQQVVQRTSRNVDEFLNSEGTALQKPYSAPMLFVSECALRQWRHDVFSQEILTLTSS